MLPQLAVSPEERPESPEILIVDDDEELLEVIAMAFDRCGYRYRTATDGRKALEEIERTRPDMVLLDMKLPVMDGWEFARRLYDRYGRLIPVAVMTAAEDSEIRANEIGADSYIGKPFDTVELCKLVHSIVAAREG